LAIVLVIQFIIPQIRSGNEVFGGDYTPARSASAYSPTVVLSQDAVCKSPPLFPFEGKQSRIHKMGLLEEAKKVAAEFEYPPEAVNAGVKEFLREMGEHVKIVQRLGNSITHVPNQMRAGRVHTRGAWP
jgi:hexokinase